MKIVNAYVSEGDLYEVMGECSPLHVCDFFIHAEGVDGKIYCHKHVFKGCGYDDCGAYPVFDHDAGLFADKVYDAGEINLDHWFEVSRRPSYALGEVDEVSLMDDEERFHKGY